MSGAPKRKMGYYTIEPEGIELPSVTTVLKVIAKPALMNWYAKQGALAVLTDPVKYDTPEKAAAAIYQVGDVAMKRGSDAHTLAEIYGCALADGIVDVSELCRGLLKGF